MSETRVDDDTTADGGSGDSVNVCGTPFVDVISWLELGGASATDTMLFDELPPETCARTNVFYFINFLFYFCGFLPTGQT
jgi:hypothetical protein